MDNREERLFKVSQEEAMRKALQKGFKIEIIPNKVGFKIVKVERHELKSEN